MQRGRMYFNLLFTEQRHRLDGFILWIYVQDGIRLLERPPELIPAAFQVVAPSRINFNIL